MKCIFCNEPTEETKSTILQDELVPAHDKCYREQLRLDPDETRPIYRYTWRTP